MKKVQYIESRPKGEKVKICCNDLAMGFNSGTDNEGYGSLFSIYAGAIHAGSDMSDILYCPYCSEKIEVTES